MTSASNAAVVYQNLADAGTIAVSSSASASTGGEQLKDPHIGRKWRAAGNSGTITLDLGSVQPVDTLALIGVNLSAAGTTRIKLSTSDPSAGNVYDSGDQVGLCDPRYKQFAVLTPAPLNARFAQIVISDASQLYVQAGRLVTGLRNQYERNFSYGWNYRHVDRSRRTESRGGQLFIDKDNSYRTVDLTFNGIPKAQRYGFIEDMDIVSGRSEDVLMILDPTGNMSRDFIWGLIDSEEPIIQPYFERFSRSYSIRERL